MRIALLQRATQEMSQDNVRNFITRWRESGGSEKANSQMFLNELCALLEVPPPDTAEPYSEGDYVFERRVVFHHGDGTTSLGYIDLYKRGCFVLESKQGTLLKEREALSQAERDKRAKVRKGTAIRGSKGWDEAMLLARGQGERYIRHLPAKEGRPPFLIVVDVGHSIELYSEFSCTGGAYIPFPDANTHRIHLDDLLDPEIRERLRQVWLDPHGLDPSTRAAKVTREIAGSLGALAKSLEASGHSPESVSGFLMRCLFTMFAEDVGLLTHDSFTRLLESMRETPEHLAPNLEDLWSAMDKGGYSTAIQEKIRRFNGGLFKETTALPLNRDQAELLYESAQADWRDVEPAIFGTLLERALDPRERHKLGAHYTPRAYVERLVLPTIIEPLRQEWNEVGTAAVAFLRKDKTDEAIQVVQGFHRKLCRIKILDPACGSANFLYVTLEHLKRLEGEVLDLEKQLGFSWARMEGGGLTIDPQQFLGLELNPRAAKIAELVLWIGYLQWQFRTMKGVFTDTVIQDYKNIECRDALITYDSREPRLDGEGQPVTVWDGRTTRPHPATGREVPDETARIPVYTYKNPRQAKWPQADYIIGNPPFIGASTMRGSLGDGYVEAVRSAYDKLPASCDYVMYWWNHAARLVRSGKLQRFGFISTNSIKQTFNRRVIQEHMSAKVPVSLAFAIPDHPWVDSADGADVRIAMTVGRAGKKEGRLARVVRERKTGMEREVELEEARGIINADLTIGVDISLTRPLLSNEWMCIQGVKLHGAGFILTKKEAKSLGLGTVKGIDGHIRPFLHGRDVAGTARGVFGIDFFGLSESNVRARFPEAYQWLLENVKPQRDQNKRTTYRDNWWIFGEPRRELRPGIKGLSRYITTVYVARHRFFVFLDSSIIPESGLMVIASEDAFHLGVLSSHLHIIWALAAGGTLEDRPRYNNSVCFSPFPFPDATDDQKAAIRVLGEELDAHRKRQLDLHPKLTMTQMYNVLEALRQGRELTPAERTINEQGLVTLLKDIHDRLDAAVADAYGWSADLAEHEILERLVALNAERAQEEARGVIRWLRPEYQAARHKPVSAKQATLDTGKTVKKGDKPQWPGTLAERTRAVLEALQDLGGPAPVDAVRKAYRYAHAKQVQEILDALAALGQVTRLPDGRYVKH